MPEEARGDAAFPGVGSVEIAAFSPRPRRRVRLAFGDLRAVTIIRAEKTLFHPLADHRLCPTVLVREVSTVTESVELGSGWALEQTVGPRVRGVRAGVVFAGALTTLYLPEWAQWMIIGVLLIMLSLYVVSYSDA